MTPKATRGPNAAAHKEEIGILSQDEGEVRSPEEEAASPTPAGKEVAEEEGVAGHGREGSLAPPLGHLLPKSL